MASLAPQCFRPDHTSLNALLIIECVCRAPGLAPVALRAGAAVPLLGLLAVQDGNIVQQALAGLSALMADPQCAAALVNGDVQTTRVPQETMRQHFQQLANLLPPAPPVGAPPQQMPPHVVAAAEMVLRIFHAFAPHSSGPGGALLLATPQFVERLSALGAAEMGKAPRQHQSPLAVPTMLMLAASPHGAAVWGFLQQSASIESAVALLVRCETVADNDPALPLSAQMRTARGARARRSRCARATIEASIRSIRRAGSRCSGHSTADTPTAAARLQLSEEPL